ncbi:MAG: DUF167 family protein [Myxococcales bacterium]|jgi:uncharacterized protein (TIGR00251 family)
MESKNEAEHAVRVTVRAKPRASHSRIARVDGLKVEVALAAPPVDGAANEALIELLAKALSLSKSSLTLVLGQTSKHKVVEITGLSADEVTARLAATLSS